MKSGLYFISIVLLLTGCASGEGSTKSDRKKSGGFFSQLFSSSNEKELSAAAYINYVEDPGNGLLKEKEIDDIKFSLQYEPYEYLCIKELGHDSVKKEELQAAIKEREDMDYFVLKIQAKNNNQELLKYKLSDEKQYQERVDYFSFRMQDDIKLIEGKDSLFCRMFHFERIFGVAPYAKFVLGFEKSKRDEDKLFVFEDRVFKSGTIKLIITKEDITNIPSLKIY
jgi:hypothetical protein